MVHSEDIQRLILSVHALTRMAALETKNEAPSAQWRTLRLLREFGAQRIGELARLSRISQPGMTRLVGQLAHAGLVERFSDPTDSRVIVVDATPAGLEALDGWLEQLQATIEPLLEGLDEAEWDALRTTAAALARTTAMPEVVR